jgi:hypothetical protein
MGEIASVTFSSQSMITRGDLGQGQEDVESQETSWVDLVVL